MQNKLKKLDVDCIGEEEPLTREEELSISEFIQSNKKKNKRKHTLIQMEQLPKNQSTLVTKYRAQTT